MDIALYFLVILGEGAKKIKDTEKHLNIKDFKIKHLLKWLFV